MNLSGIIGKKMYQTLGFLEDGTRVPLTVVATKGNLIVQVKTTEKEGYNSLQLGFESKKKPLKREVNHAKKAGIKYTPRFLREFRVEDVADFENGKEILAADVLKPGDVISVTGTSKGKGYAGVVKRHHFKGGPRTHGQSDRERAPGSIGQTTTPGRVYKGKRMAGRMGNETSTAKNLEVIEITDDGLLLIKGLIPGGVNSIITIRKTGENKKFVPLFKEVQEQETVGENPPAGGEENKEEVPAVEVVENKDEAIEIVEEKAEETVGENPPAGGEEVKEEDAS